MGANQEYPPWVKLIMTECAENSVEVSRRIALEVEHQARQYSPRWKKADEWKQSNER